MIEWMKLAMEAIVDVMLRVVIKTTLNDNDWEWERIIGKEDSNKFFFLILFSLNKNVRFETATRYNELYIYIIQVLKDHNHIFIELFSNNIKLTTLLMCHI